MPRFIAVKPPRFEDCEVHPKHVKGQFCLEHQISVCCLCAITIHTGCKVLSVDDECKSISSSDITSTYDIISNLIENIKAVTTSLETNIEQLKVEKADALEDVQDMYHKVRSKFNEMYEKFKHETKENYQEQQMVLLKHQVQLEDQVARLETSLSDIDRLKGKPVDAKVFLKMQDVLNVIKESKQSLTISVLFFEPFQFQ